ncbi:hypothetical protein diail_6792 [Diaporthe ilicicola]|nr:hypothetical protein diail_6792 [Diaporthe ilicicola]
MDQRHESFFSYNITRPFPFRWFTPVAVIGGAVLAALFTFLNFASSAYVLTIETSADPNATVSRYVNSMQLWPSYLTSKIKPICQPTSLPVGTQFFTNQTALMYTLTSVWQETPLKATQSAPWPQPLYSPSLAYLNNILENCRVKSIQIDVESQDRAANQLAITEWGARVRTSTICQTSTEAGVVFLNMTQSYDYVPDTVTFAQLYTFLGSGIVSRDKTKRASMWWGESLMSTYWAQLTWRLQQETRDKSDRKKGAVEWPIRKASLYFVPDPGVRIDNINFFQYFRAQYVPMTNPGEYVFPKDVMWGKSLENIIQEKTYPDIWEPAVNLAKSAYATILVDLGQTSTAPTMLTDETLLRSFTANLADVQREKANAWPGPAINSYDETTGTGPLSVTPSVISAQYFCQVPHMRSAGSLIIAIIVADLVFLQSAWQLYKFVCGYWVGRKDKDSDVCSGCLNRPSGPLTVESREIISGKDYERVAQHEIDPERTLN